MRIIKHATIILIQNLWTLNLHISQSQVLFMSPQIILSSVSNALGTDSILQRIASLVVREEVWMHKIKLPCWEIYSHVVFFILLLAMRLTKSRFVLPKFDLLVIPIIFFIPKIYLLIFRISCISLPIKSYA